MPRSRPFHRFGIYLLVAGLAAGPGLVHAEDPAPSAAEPSLEDRLRRQDEMLRLLVEQNRQLAEQNQRLGDQNRKFGEKLEDVTRRLDALSPSVPAPPPSALPPKDGAVTASAATTGGGTGGVPGSASDPANAELADSGDAPVPVVGPDPGRGMVDSLHRDGDYGLKSLFDSLHPEGKSGKPWYEKLSIRGYTQVRFGRSLYQGAGGPRDPHSAPPSLLGDASINGRAEDFSIRRARLILSGDVSDHLGLYFQSDFANTPPDSNGATFFAQIRDLYADVYLDKTKVHRLRVGQSKIPYGFEVMQSSGNRVPLDRTDALDSGVSPNQRDLGVFYYWTPAKKQDLLRELAEGGLKGSGNYGIFAFGTYNGQGGSLLERNLNLYTVARLTWPVRLDNGQVIEASIQGFKGQHVTDGAPIRPLGRGPLVVPAGTGGFHGLRDQRVAATFVYYPQPFGFQAEWNIGEGPGLNNNQTDVEVRSLNGGYAMAMVKIDTERCGIFIPYTRYQHYRGGYRSFPNAPYGNHDQWDLGVEWQIRKEMEVVTEYSFVDGVNLEPFEASNFQSYRNFVGGVFRVQFQFNY